MPPVYAKARFYAWPSPEFYAELGSPDEQGGRNAGHAGGHQPVHRQGAEGRRAGHGGLGLHGSVRQEGREAKALLAQGPGEGLPADADRLPDPVPRARRARPHTTGATRRLARSRSDPANSTSADSGRRGSHPRKAVLPAFGRRWGPLDDPKSA